MDLLLLSEFLDCDNFCLAYETETIASSAALASARNRKRTANHSRKINFLMALCDELEQQIESSQTQIEQLMQSCLKEVFEGSTGTLATI